MAAKKVCTSIKNRDLELLGWLLFMVSASAYIVASVGNFWSMLGSVFFLVACFVFVIPFFRVEGN